MMKRALFVPVLACFINSMAYGYQAARATTVSSLAPVAASPAAPASAPAGNAADPAAGPLSGGDGAADLGAMTSGAEGGSGARPALVLSGGGGAMSAGLVLSLLLKLAVVLGLAYGASLLLRRINSRSIIRRGGCLHVLETVPLGQGRSLHVVSVGARRLLVASANQQVRLLDDITEDAAGAPEPEPDAPRGQHEDFIARVLQLLQRPKAPSPEAASASPIEYSRPPARSHTVTIRPSAGESRA